MKNLIQCAIHYIYSLLLYINSDFSLFIYSFVCLFVRRFASCSSFILTIKSIRLQCKSHNSFFLIPKTEHGQIGKYKNICYTFNEMDATIAFITGNIKSKHPIAQAYDETSRTYLWRDFFCMCKRYHKTTLIIIHTIFTTMIQGSGTPPQCNSCFSNVNEISQKKLKFMGCKVNKT